MGADILDMVSRRASRLQQVTAIEAQRAGLARSLDAAETNVKSLEAKLATADAALQDLNQKQQELQLQLEASEVEKARVLRIGAQVAANAQAMDAVMQSIEKRLDLLQSAGDKSELSGVLR